LKSEIIAGGVTQVKVRDDTWPWMATLDAPVDPANHIYKYNNLRLFSNWADMGIAYANMTMTAPWSGVINQENQYGIFRYSSNTTIFPGLKLWTWGNNSINIDPTKDFTGARPYIELWGGHSHEFFEPATILARSSKKTTFYYLPTIGLEWINSMNKYGAVELSYELGPNQVDLQAKMFSTYPSISFQILLGWVTLEGKETILYKTIYEPVTNFPSIFITTYPTIGLPTGQYGFTFYLQNLQGQNLLTGNIMVSLTN